MCVKGEAADYGVDLADEDWLPLAAARLPNSYDTAEGEVRADADQMT